MKSLISHLVAILTDQSDISKVVAKSQLWERSLQICVELRPLKSEFVWWIHFCAAKCYLEFRRNYIWGVPERFSMRAKGSQEYESERHSHHFQVTKVGWTQSTLLCTLLSKAKYLNHDIMTFKAHIDGDASVGIGDGDN